MLYTFYGDDFTGSTDVLEQLVLKGLRSVLFLHIPNEEQLARFADAEAIGLAGDSRSQSPGWMDEHLPPAFEFLKSQKAQFNHYKVCSTFDSSAARGNIGRAIEIGSRVFDVPSVPVIVFAPHLKRYVTFGNLFARDSDGEIKRIDRHSMAHHPATPMREADLGRHLASQADMKTASLSLPVLRSPDAAVALAALIESGAKAVVFDGVDQDDVMRTGELVRTMARSAPLFVVGSSGVTAALLSSKQSERDETCVPLEAATRKGPLLVISGSCSLVTKAQIEHATSHGFRGFALDTSMLARSKEVENMARQVSDALAEGVSVVVYTALGPQSSSTSIPYGGEVGTAVGILMKNVVQQAELQRVMLCGGDTSSHAVQQLGCYALTAMQVTQPGAPLCRLHTDDPSLDGLELILKGGQVGSRDFFEFVRDL